MEHVLSLGGFGFIAVHGVLFDTHTFPHILPYLGLGRVILVISHKVDFMDCVREVVDVLVVLKVGHEVVEMPIISLV